MCGFFGCYLPSLSKEALAAGCERAANALAHRGPDDSGVWVSDSGLGLSHRRLSILDLSELGHQPYTSPQRGLKIVYNGEIYNFKTLRKELQQDHRREFVSNCDTEVLAVALEEWGIEATLGKLNGMFAFAVWDEQEQVLTLARDRIGIKPLYYGWNADGFYFSSELKGCFAFPEFRSELNREALSLFFQHNYIPDPYCILRSFFKLLPGSWVTLSAEQLKRVPEGFSPFASEGALSPTTYWRPRTSGERSNFSGSREEAEEELHTLLGDSVQLRTVADVPVGAFLSGGIDSSLVVSLLAHESGELTKTFSIGFDLDEYNEAPFAKAIADRLGTDHQELYVKSEEALSVVPRLVDIYDEPFADSSQIPTILVSELARQQVTVSLSGDGGDELFSGYSRYAIVPELWKLISILPRGVRVALSHAIKLPPAACWTALYRLLSPFLPAKLRGQKYVAYKVARLCGVLQCKTLGELNRCAVTHWVMEEHPVEFFDGETVLGDRALEDRFDSVEEYLSYVDLHTYLPGDILHKVDRASMSCSLEARVPLLDHRVIEFAETIPVEWKVSGGKQKKILRDVLERYVPQDLFERPKTGFGVPLHEWLRGPLREWGEELLGSDALPEGGILNRTLVRSTWERHQARKADLHYPLWDVLIFQAWLHRWREQVLL